MLTKEQDRERKRRQRDEMTAEQKNEERRQARERMARRRREQGVPTRAERWERHRACRPARVARIKPRPLPKAKPQKAYVPAEVREAWRKSHPNSVIRRKYPTMAALERRWGQ